MGRIDGYRDNGSYFGTLYDVQDDPNVLSTFVLPDLQTILSGISILLLKISQDIDN